jgi:tRNA G18 (ribose-2'-O)-methylase SpoU
MTPAFDGTNIWELEPPERLAVMFGAEGPGLSARSMQAATRRVRLPIDPDVDSLNIGAAAAVTFATIARPT